MSVAFHDTRFPEFFTVGLEFGPDWDTSVVEFKNGREQRNQNHEDARRVADVSKAVQTQDEYDVILAFFRARRGRFHPFRAKDWTNFRLLQEPTSPATGDGFLTAFQVVQTFENVPEPPAAAAIRPQVQTIKTIRGGVNDPILTVDTPGTVVRVNGSPVTVIFTGGPAAGEVLVNTLTGLLTFGTAPTNGFTVDFTGEFDVPMRFDIDRLPGVLDDFNVASVRSIPMIEDLDV